MTDSAGTPPGPKTPDADGSSSTAGPRMRRRWLRWAALGVVVAVLAGVAIVWSAYRKLDDNITADTGTVEELERYERERPTQVALDAQNILLIGSDSRDGAGNDQYGRAGTGQRSDTTILLHLAADRNSATAVSLPRDLMVTIPACRRDDGRRTRKRFAQFNSAYQSGGTACTIRTVEKLTRIRVDHHMVVDFTGFKRMVDAVDGVEVCLEEPVDDPDAQLELPAGPQKLDGEQALGYVRARKSIGNGSDTGRMIRQQEFLAALVEKVQSSGVLLNPTRLYPLLDAATSSLTTDPGLSSLRDLYELARSMRSIPTERIQFLTVPRRPYRYDPNRDELVQPDARRLFGRLRTDAPVRVTPRKDGDDEEQGTEIDATGDDKSENSGNAEAAQPTPAPSFPGTTAARAMCK